jgi:hypothetical protein
MANLTREQILARRLGRDVVEIGDGETVEVRGLNRHEAIAAGEIDDKTERDAYITATGMVDPKMTIEDVKTWGEQDAGGILERVSLRIGELSRMVEGAGKSGVSRPRRRS